MAVLLFAHALLMVLCATPMLRRVTRAGIAPGLGTAVWLAVLACVLGSVVTALALAMLVLVGVLEASRPIPPAAFVATVVLAVLVVVAGVRWVRALRRMRARADEHADALRLLGRRFDCDRLATDVVVLEADRPAAYCVAGRRGIVVVTSAAMAALDPVTLRAVLAHEAAHLDGRHPLLLTVVRGLAAAFPGLPGMRWCHTVAREVGRLLEMSADDAAARRHGVASVLSGLLTLSGAVPSGALGASGQDVVARAERLAAGSRRCLRVRISLCAIIVFAFGIPVVIVLARALGALGPLVWP